MRKMSPKWAQDLPKGSDVIFTPGLRVPPSGLYLESKKLLTYTKVLFNHAGGSTPAHWDRKADTAASCGGGWTNSGEGSVESGSVVAGKGAWKQAGKVENQFHKLTTLVELISNLKCVLAWFF